MAIASVQQAAFGDHNIQYQFRTENNGGQVRPRAGAGGERGAERGAAGGLGGARTRPLPGPQRGLAALPPPAGDIPRSPGD